MTADEIRRAVLAALVDVAPEVDVAALHHATAFAEQIDLDSMDFLMFVTGLAEATGIEVPEADYGRVASVDDCVAYLSAAAV